MLLSLWIGKVILLLLRLTGRRGSSFPGLIVERIHPGFLREALSRLPDGVIVISGTNGKTTTTKMIATLLGQEQPGVPFEVRAFEGVGKGAIAAS